MFTAMPIDMMVELDDAGIDFSTINDYELFLILFSGLKEENLDLIIDGVDLREFEIGVNEQNGMTVLVNPIQEIVIDREVHAQIANALRRIHHLKKDRRTPGNDAAKKYLIERKRKKMERNKNRKVSSQLEYLIVSLVNSEKFKYDFETVKNLTIYQFNESLSQVDRSIAHHHLMNGVYAGTVDHKEVAQEKLTWIKHDENN